MAERKPQQLSRITQDPDVMVGKPVVRGTRIPVSQVLGHLAENPDLDDLFGAYPGLTVEDVKAVLSYAQEVVDAKDKRTARRAHANPV
jgi:uncharacterized protein (DUF433 family)